MNKNPIPNTKNRKVLRMPFHLTKKKYTNIKAYATISQNENINKSNIKNKNTNKNKNNSKHLKTKN